MIDHIFTISSSFERESFIKKCFGPDASELTYGKLISVSTAVESSCFARSAASFKRCKASGSFEISMPSCFLYSETNTH